MNGEQLHHALTDALKRITDFFGVECRVEIQQEQDQRGKNILLSLHTDQDAKFLIGRNGQNLRALEHVMRLMCAKIGTEEGTVTLDINNYRRSRAQQAIELAKQAMQRVKDSQKAEALFPMSAYERRIVHLELASCPDVVTESIGEEPNRRVIIKPFSLD